MASRLAHRALGLVFASLVCSVATGLVAMVVLGLYYQRVPTWAVAVIASVSFLVTVPAVHEIGQALIQLVFSERSRLATAALIAPLSVLPMLLLVQVFREPGEPLVQLNRMYIGEAIPWLITFGLSAALFSYLRQRRIGRQPLGESPSATLGS